MKPVEQAGPVRTAVLGLGVALGIVALIGAAGPGCGKGPPARPAPPPPKVTVAHPEEREIVDSDEFSGWLAAPETVEVRARVRGHIDKVHFKDGDTVRAGDLLFTLDKRPIQAELDGARAGVGVYEAQRFAAEKEVARQKELLEKGVTSSAAVEKAEADLGTLDAQIEAAKQEVRRLELDLAYAEIRAPIAGRTGRALLTAGNYVNAGGSDPVLTTIVNIDPIHIYFYVDERSLLDYRAARRKVDPEAARKRVSELEIPCYFALESDEGHPHEGRLDFAENRIDPRTGTLLVRGSAPNAELRFTPGSRVRVRVPVSPPYRALLVPDTAVLTDQDKRYVLVVGPGAVVLRRDVKLGRLLDDGARVILGDLDAKAGARLRKEDLIVALGLQTARVNYPVEPLDANGKPVPPPPPPAASP